MFARGRAAACFPRRCTLLSCKLWPFLAFRPPDLVGAEGVFALRRVYYVMETGKSKKLGKGRKVLNSSEPQPRMAVRITGMNRGLTSPPYPTLKRACAMCLSVYVASD